MSYEEIEFSRHCDAVQIPQGIKITIPKGTAGVITQSLGDTYTLQLPTLGGLYRVSDSDADAIGKESKGPAPEAAPSANGEVSEDQVWAQLKNVYDPEIPVNIVDLGLVYDVQLKDTGDVYVQMTLTFPGCGMGPYIGQQAEWAVQELDGVEEVEIEMVFDPPWSPELISEEARSQLGI